MRGKAARPGQEVTPERITPAHAGKRVFRVVLYVLHRDHPRACGEKLDAIQLALNA